MENKDIIIDGESTLSEAQVLLLTAKHLESLDQFRNQQYYKNITEIKDALEVIKPHLSDTDFENLVSSLLNSAFNERFGK